MTTLTLIDQTPSGTSLNRIDIPFESEEITLRELITTRVEYEVEQYNAKESQPYYGLVTPTPFEKILNNISASSLKRIVDAEKQVYVALDGFLKNQFFVFINDKQVDDLNAKFRVDEVDQVSFIKLTPLVGG